MELTVRATADMVRQYHALFVNRRAYVLQSVRPHAASGRHYYYRPKEQATGRPLGLTAETIRRHLEGHLTIGIYSTNPQTQRCKWMAIDADYRHALEDLLKLQYELGRDRVETALEKSKRGAHLWILFEKPVPARDCRIYIFNLALRLNVPVKGAGLPEGIEVFPRQDEIGPEEFGNAIRGPLGVHRGANKRYWFYGADYTLEDQFAYLARVKRVTEDELRRFIIGKSIPQEQVSPRPNDMTLSVRTGDGNEFRILDYVTTSRKVGRNWVTRCPSCALHGHDRSGDNLAILVSDPRYYVCWAGCTKEMIRDAVGRPIRFRRSA